jgi:citrate lyase subunit beta-like protein
MGRQNLFDSFQRKNNNSRTIMFSTQVAWKNGGRILVQHCCAQRSIFVRSTRVGVGNHHGALFGGIVVRRLATTTVVVPPNNNHRPRRSLLSVPGVDERKIEKSKSIGADAVVLDLEDGVALDRKDDARDLVVQTLLHDSSTFGRSEVCVRINGLDTKELALRDLQAILPLKKVQAIVIPKVESAADVQFVSRMMDALTTTSNSDIRILAAIESAVGMMNLRDIAAACPERLDALIFASEDYCADLELIRTTPNATELLHARSQIVLAAKAYGLQAIDMVHIDFRNLNGLALECQQGREMGFTGKQAIHPIQVETIHQAFSPSRKDVDFATRVVQEYEAAIGVGKGACEVDGIAVDAPVYKWAIKILRRAEIAGMLLGRNESEEEEKVCPGSSKLFSSLH